MIDLYSWYTSNGRKISIADIAIWPWVARFPWQKIDLARFSNVRRWYESIAARPAVKRGWHVPENEQGIPLPGERGA